MISKLYIGEEVSMQIQENFKHCSEGKLLGFHDRETGTVNVLAALPLGMPGYGGYQRVGMWGIDPRQAPAFPKPDEIFLHLTPESPSIQAYRVLSQGLEPLEAAEIIRSDSNPFERIQGLFDTRLLFDKKVAIVGMGSVGSLVALELAKSGVSRFLLYDPDTLSVSNVCRHVGDLKDVGRYKTRIVEERILGRNPRARILTHETDILRIEEEDLKNDWKEVGLIVAATDTRQATLMLNQVALDLNVSLIWVGLYERASWGHILYTVPRDNPCLACVLPTLGEIEDLAPKEERIIDYSSATDVGQMKAEPGLGTDIGFVSMTGAKIALALLLTDDPTSTLKDMLPSGKTLLVVANSPGSLFPETKAFQTAWLETSVREDCEWCQKDQQYRKRYGKDLPQLQIDAQQMVADFPDLSTIGAKYLEDEKENS